MLLFLDTSEISLVTFVLVDPTAKKKPKAKTYKLGYGDNWKTLSFLQLFLKSNKCRLPLARRSLGEGGTINSLVVCSGPGSPTGLRVGVALAQGLAYGLGIPLRAIKKSQVPTNLQNLARIRGGKNFSITYSRPAV